MQATQETYQERIIQLSERSVKVLTYSVGKEFVCIVSNVDPDATICRAKASSHQQAIRLSIENAQERLRATRSAETEPIVLVSGSDLALLEYDSPTGIRSFSPEEFQTIKREERAQMFLSGAIRFYDSNGKSINSGEAIRNLLALG